MSTKKKTQNPLSCGCAAMGQMDLENAVDDGHSLHIGYKNTHVVFCALHQAAPDLLAALQYWVDAAQHDEKYSAWLGKARAALTKASPPEPPTKPGEGEGGGS